MRKLLIAAAILTAAVAAYAGRLIWLNHNQLPAGLLQVNGRLEGDRVTVSGKFPGRIDELRVREGEQVAKGQVLIQLDSKQFQARLDQARHTVAVDEAMITAAQAEVSAIEAELKAGQTALDLLERQIPLQIARSEAEVEHAEAVLASAVTSLEVQQDEYERAMELSKTNAIAEEELARKRLAFRSASNEVTSAQAALKKARKSLEETQLGYARIEQQRDELAALQSRLERSRAAVAQNRARHQASLAALAEAESNLEDLTIVAPTDGTVVTRMVNQGEVVAAGAPLYDLVDLDRLYLKVYVPEPEIGKVRLGLKAKVYTDAFPDRPFDATLRYIASDAEFTPKEVQTVDERVKLVYAVRLYLDENPDHRLTPGLPADAVIRWKGDAPWTRPQW